ncbi:hypothetical protein BGW41_005990 [Actinomortierella wolfii]|nr:hypothetical protein BGW41_005990 [Actinomortierella wolfii]
MSPVNATTNSSSTQVNEKGQDHHRGREKGHRRSGSHSRRSISLSRRSSFESAIQGNGVVLAKNERLHGSSRPTSINATYDEDVVMESGWRGYLVVLGGFLVILAAIGFVSIAGIFQAKWLEIYSEQGKSPSQISFISSLATGFQFGFTLIAGPVMNRFGYKVILYSGCIIGSAGLLLASWTTELWQLYITQGVMFGIGASLLNLAATAIPPLWYDKHRGTAMGICFSGAGIGGLIFGFVIPALIKSLDVYWALRIFAIFHFVCSLFAAIVMRAPRQLSGPPIQAKKDVMDWSMMKDFGFMLWFLAAALYGFAYVIPFIFIPDYAKDVVGLDAVSQGGALLSIISGCNAVGRIIIGAAGDRLGSIRVAAVCFMITGASCFIWMFATSHGALIGFSIVYGIFSGSFFTLVASITANIVGLAALGSGLTVILLTNTPGNLFTGPIAGKLLENTGGYKAMAGYNAALYLVGGGILFLLMVYNHYTRRSDKA